jgi:hypothetical protein
MNFQKHYFLKAYTGCSEPEPVHTWAALLVGRVHMHSKLSTGHVPVDILTYVEDYCLISVGAKCVI